jgi:hypothetical protein
MNNLKMPMNISMVTYMMPIPKQESMAALAISGHADEGIPCFIGIEFG